MATKHSGARRPPSQAEMAKRCSLFNSLNPVGSKVRVWTGMMNDGPGKVVEIAAPGAYVMSGHTAVVQTVGIGCVALTHVKPAEASDHD